jgi:hypothetical protein
MRALQARNFLIIQYYKYVCPSGKILITETVKNIGNSYDCIFFYCSRREHIFVMRIRTITLVPVGLAYKNLKHNQFKSVFSVYSVSKLFKFFLTFCEEFFR